MKLTIINLESKMPTVDQARIRLDQALRHAKSQKQPVLKLIHGYGSTGKGGAIKKDIALYLKEQKTKGRIVGFVHGEDFSPFSTDGREALKLYPALYRDTDYSRDNRGITLVIISSGV